MVIKTFSEFIRNKYRGFKKPATLPLSMTSRIQLEELFKEDIIEYQKYLQRVEELKTVPKYAL